MIDYLYGADQTVAGFVAAMIPHVRQQGFVSGFKAIGVVEDNELIAGFVYHNWDPQAQVMEMSGAALPGKQWLTRETIRRFWRYPYLDCDCQMTFMRVDSENERLLGQLAALGYDFILVPRLAGRDKNTMLCTLTREAWQANKFTKRLKPQFEPLEEAA